jgi:DNA-binding CsgD family transcriptional regulator
MAAEPERAPLQAAAWRTQLRGLVRLLDGRAPTSRGAARHAPIAARAVRDRLSVVLDAGSVPDAETEANDRSGPFRLMLEVGLQPGVPALRWAVAAAARTTTIEQDAADDRHLALPRRALELLDAGPNRRSPIVVSGLGERPDRLLADLAPGFAALVVGLTARQREVGRLLLVEGLRRSEVAAALGISRPTVSVMVDRARLLEIERFARGLDSVVAGALPPGAERVDPEA